MRVAGDRFCQTLILFGNKSAKRPVQLHLQPLFLPRGAQRQTKGEKSVPSRKRHPRLCQLSRVILAVCLACSCQQSRRHSVTLNWRAPEPRAGVTIVGYNVYRRTSDGGGFVRIADRVSGPPYEDRLVNSGTKYIYVVTAVDQAGRESRYSAETEAEVP